MSKIRKVLMSVIDSDRIVSADLRALCVELLYHMGLVRASAEDLLRAAIYQSKYEVNLTDEAIEFFCTQDEHYSPPITGELVRES